jgi:hypothetical protein
MRTATLAFAAVLVACSSSSTTTTDAGPKPDSSTKYDTGTDGTTKDSTSKDSPSTTDVTSPSDAISDGPALTDAEICEEGCETMNATAFEEFEVLLLQNCGCASGAACNTDCTGSCPTDGGTAPDSMCKTCLEGQAAMGTGSPCTLKAAIACMGVSSCAPFVNCAENCM